MVLVALFEAVVAFGILSCLSRVVLGRLRRLAVLTQDEGHQLESISRRAQWRNSRIPEDASDGYKPVWVVYLSHTYLGVSNRFSAEAQVIPGVRRLV